MHGDKYDYSKSEITSGKQRSITITCKVHGDFTQRPQDHLSGNGCAKCALEAKSANSSITNAEWKLRLHNKFPHIELLDNVATGYYTKVAFKCETHGEFETNLGAIQSNVHLCYECSRMAAQIAVSKKHADALTNLYYVYFPQWNLYKLGLSTHDTYTRLGNVPHEVVWSVSDTYKNIARVEYELHNEFKSFKYLGDKKLKDGNTELYTKNIIPNEEELYSLLTKLNLKLNGASSW